MQEADKREQEEYEDEATNDEVAEQSDRRSDKDRVMRESGKPRRKASEVV